MALSSNPLTSSGGQRSVFDMNALSDLKREVRESPTGAAHQAKVAQQFEALYLQMMLKQMRQAMPKSGMLDTDQTRMVQSMADEQLALQLADPGVGLAQALLRQMQGNTGTLQTESVDENAVPDGSPEANSPAGLLARKLRVESAFNPEEGSMPSISALLQVLERNRPGDRADAAAHGAPDHVVAFVSRMRDAANAAAEDSGVPARLILGQAALESGWGKREIKHENGSTSYNLFGIKAGSSWSGKVVNVMTTEFVDGVPRKMIQPFRAYNSYEESFTDYARLIGNSPRYESVTTARNAVDAAHKIQAAGYATDPNYAKKLIDIMSLMQGRVARNDISGTR